MTSSIIKSVINYVVLHVDGIQINTLINFLEAAAKHHSFELYNFYNAVLGRIGREYLLLTLNQKARIVKAIGRRAIRQKSLVQILAKDLAHEEEFSADLLAVLAELGYNN